MVMMGIPEFPFFAVLPLFMLVTLLVAMLYHKRTPEFVSFASFVTYFVLSNPFCATVVL